MTDFTVDPFEVWEQDHEYLFSQEACDHEHTIGIDDHDGTWHYKCLDCGIEF